MLLVAVKFGRMSKKQRERVEDEANFHKRQLSQVSTVNACHDDTQKSLSPTNNNHLNRYHTALCVSVCVSVSLSVCLCVCVCVCQ